MGQKVTNCSGGIDFSTGDQFIEFHRRVVVSEKDYNEIMSLLGNNKIDHAREVLLKVAPSNAKNVINLCLDELKVIKKIT